MNRVWGLVMQLWWIVDWWSTMVDWIIFSFGLLLFISGWWVSSQSSTLMRHTTNNHGYILHNNGCMLCKHGPICKQQLILFLYSILQECSYGQQYEPSQTRAGKKQHCWEYTCLGVQHSFSVQSLKMEGSS